LSPRFVVCDIRKAGFLILTVAGIASAGPDNAPDGSVRIAIRTRNLGISNMGKPARRVDGDTLRLPLAVAHGTALSL